MKARRPILVVDDDPDDQLLVQLALRRVGLNIPIETLDDGVELTHYLEEVAEGGDASRWPLIVLLDINMPRMNGFAALDWMKADPRFDVIPVIVFTSSDSLEDVRKSYSKGAASFITKPVTMEKLEEAMRILSSYWTNAVRLPE